MIEKKMVWLTPFQMERCLHIYLPDDYDQSDRTYPVLYMFDGHNLFFDQDATYGHAWHIADQYANHGVEMIVVGLECNHEGRERLHEFCPYPVSQSRLGSLDGRGAALMDWMSGELCMMIEQHYRTNGVHYLGGSSMGGLMALYGIVHCPEIYRGAACLSSSIFLCLDALQQEIRQAYALKGARIYMSYGTEETSSKKQLAAVVKNHMDLFQELDKQGAHCYFDLMMDGQHNEATWEKQVMTFTRYLEEQTDD